MNTDSSPTIPAQEPIKEKVVIPEWQYAHTLTSYLDNGTHIMLIDNIINNNINWLTLYIIGIYFMAKTHSILGFIFLAISIVSVVKSIKELHKRRKYAKLIHKNSSIFLEQTGLFNKTE